MVFSLHMVVVLVAMLVVASSALSSNPDDEWPLGEERIEPVICYGPDKNKTWSKMNVDMAWRELQSLMNAPMKTLDDKGNPFPGAFNITNFTKDNPMFSKLNSTVWTGCQPGQPNTEYLQFPIASTTQGMKYKGGAPGQDRVLALARGKGRGNYKTPMYCGVITTRGSNKKGDGFGPCNQRVKARKVTLAVPSLPPITGEGNSMFAKRDEMPRAVTCSGDRQTQHWDVGAVQSAFDRIGELMNKEDHEKPQDWKRKPFPGAFHTYEPNFSPQVIARLPYLQGCQTGQPNTHYLEFPITSPTYNGRSPGPDRVLAIAHGTRKRYTRVLYCLAMTHRRQGEKAFIPCSDFTSAPVPPPKQTSTSSSKQQPTPTPKQKPAPLPRQKPDSPPKQQAVSPPQQKPASPPKQQPASPPKQQPASPPKQQPASPPKQKITSPKPPKAKPT